MAAGAASGAVRGRGGRAARPVGDGQGVSRRGLGVLSPERAVGAFGLRLCHERVFEPQDRAGDLRFGGVSLHCGQRASRSRHHRGVPAPLSQEIKALFVQVLLLARRDGVAQAGHGGARRHQGSRQCQPAQRAVLRACGEDRGAAEGRSRGADGAGRAADAADVPDGMSMPEELARREARLAGIAEAKATIEARAKERGARAGRV